MGYCCREYVHFRLNLILDGFFAPTSSLERKYLGNQLFLFFLPQLPEDLVGSLFSQNFLRCLINHSFAGDRYLNKAAKKSVSLLRYHSNVACNNILCVRSETRDCT